MFEVVFYDVDEVLIFGGVEWLNVVFVDGVFSVEEFDDLVGEGLLIECFVDIV